MNEKEQAQRLQRDLDRLLSQETASPAGKLPEGALPEGKNEYQALLATAQELVNNDLSGQSRIRQSLRWRLTRPNAASEVWSTHNHTGVKIMKSNTRLRAAFVTISILTALVLALGSVPTVRAFAANIWQQVGPLIITNDPTTAQVNGIPIVTPTGAGETVSNPVVVAASPTPPADMGMEIQPLTREEAREAYGFEALEPGYIPQDYTLVDRPYLYRHQSGRLFSARSYTSSAPDTYLSIQQTTYQEEETRRFAVGSAEVSEVTVRGQQGTWIEQAPVIVVGDGKGGNRILPANYLMWEENGSFFVIDSATLSLEELLKVAESLQ